MPSNEEAHQPACLLAHNVVNKLTAIVGLCDLLKEKAEQQDAECVDRLTRIQGLAKLAAKELIDHQCNLSSIIEMTKSEESAAVFGKRVDTPTWR